MKYLLIIFIFFGGIKQLSAQASNKLFLSLNYGVGLTGRALVSDRQFMNLENQSTGQDEGSFSDRSEVYYNPNNSQLENKRNGLFLPIEIGLNYAFSKKAVVKIQYGTFRSYSKMREVPNDFLGSAGLGVYHPFLVNEVTVGLQFTNPYVINRGFSGLSKKKNYIAPIVRSYFEIEYTHSFYSLISEYTNTKPSIQFGSVNFGMYRNFYFQNSKSLFFFGGIKSGFPVLFNRADYNSIPQNSEQNLDLNTSWDEIFSSYIRKTVFQFKIGVKYLFLKKA